MGIETDQNPWFKVVNELEARGEAYVLITVLGSRGSTPRDSGTKMVVTSSASYNSIGGGHLEYKAIAVAREMLNPSPDICDPDKQIAAQKPQQKIEHFPLGARLGQCCGGSATLLFESFTGAELNIMLFGAGHVGKALAGILGQLPCRLHWVDSREEEFPTEIAGNVLKIVNDCPSDEVASMPPNSYYVVMTHNHPLDFAISEAILKRDDARYIGLIGSKTKWQRFKMRFEHRQYDPECYSQVRCPVGLSDIPGKLPIEVAVSIAGEIIADFHSDRAARDVQQGVNWRDIKDFAGSALKPLSAQHQTTQHQSTHHLEISKP